MVICHGIRVCSPKFKLFPDYLPFEKLQSHMLGFTYYGLASEGKF